MKLAILTFHQACNCGAMLQAWAMQTVLQRMGHKVSFPDCQRIGRVSILPKLATPFDIMSIMRWLYFTIVLRRGQNLIFRRGFKVFLDKHLHHEPCSADEIEDKYDLLIVGSDQVWNHRLTTDNFWNLFLGSELTQRKPIGGYALSCGDAKPSPPDLEDMRTAATQFKFISFREKALPTYLGIANPNIVCDPTLLLSEKDYINIERPRLIQGDYVFLYCISDATATLRCACSIADSLKLKLVVAGQFAPTLKMRFNTRYVFKYATDPSMMLSYIRYAKYVIVSSFHGCVFSMLYHKQFVCLYAGLLNENSRQQTLMTEADIPYRMLSTSSSATEIVSVLKTHYDVTDRLERIKSYSHNWLKDQIECA